MLVFFVRTTNEGIDKNRNGGNNNNDNNTQPITRVQRNVEP